MAFNFSAPTAASTAASAPTSFSFGLVTTQPQAKPAFGAAAQPAASAPAAGTFSFAQPAATASTAGAPGQTSAPGTGFNFGQPSATSAPASTLPAFGAAFGQPAAALTATQQAATQQQQQQQVITFQTKFSDLPAEAQKQIREIDDFIKTQLQLSDNLAAKQNGDIIQSLSSEVSRLRKTQATISAMLEKDLSGIQKLKDEVRKENGRVEIASRIVEAEKSGKGAEIQRHRHYSTIQYLYENEEEFRRRSAEYTSRINELEDNISSLARAQATSPQSIPETIREQHNLFLVLADRVAGLHSAVDVLRQRYLDYRREFFGDVRNPFAKSRKRHAGLINDDDQNISFKDFANQFVEPSPFAVLPAPAATAAAPGQSMFGTSTFGATGAATTGTGFGATATAAPSSGLFGSTATSTAPFGTTTTAAPTTSLFGGFGKPAAPATAATTATAPSSAPATSGTSFSFGFGQQQQQQQDSNKRPATSFSFGTGK